MPRLLSAALAAATIAAAPASPAVNARVFDAAWRQVKAHYWDRALHGVDWNAARDRYRPQALAAPDAEALYAVLNHMLTALHDSHVFAVPPAEVRYEADRDKGDTQASFGLDSYDEPGGWLVTVVRAGGPAALAGVRPGWRLLTIDGRPVDPDRHPIVGEQARLGFVDPAGDRHTLLLTAEPAAPGPAVTARMLPGQMLLVRLEGFDGHEDRAVRAALDRSPPPAAVILDLRDNDGGEEEVAAKVAGLFFADRHTLLRRIGRSHAEDVPIEPAGRRAYTGPLAVLVGSRSASAAEALAAMLADSGRAVAVGERTAGALTGASLIGLPDGGELSLAEFDVRAPDGGRIEGRGFEPAHLVSTTPAEMAAGRDPVLAEAVALLTRSDSISLGKPLHARP